MSPLPAALRPIVRDELERLCASEALASSASLERLLRHLVERHLDGDTAALRETAIALELFARDPRTWDAQADPIVRVAARRLREQLDRHYARPGSGEQVRIGLPKGRYVPAYEFRVAGEAIDLVGFAPVRNGTGEPALDASCAALVDRMAAGLAGAGMPVAGPTGPGAPDWWIDATLARDAAPHAEDLRCTVRLVRASDGSVRWSRAGSAPRAELDRLARTIAGALVAQVLAMRALAPAGGGSAPGADDDAKSDAIATLRVLLWQGTEAAVAEAERRALEAVERHPDAAGAWAQLSLASFARLRAGAWRDAGLRERAAGAAARAFELDPADPEVLHARAVALALVERRADAALELLGRVLRDAPQHLQARLERAELLRAGGDADAALADLDAAQAYAALAPPVRRARARHLALAGRLADAEAEWTMLRAAGEDPFAVDLGLGWLAARAGRHDEARAHARAAAALAPDRPEPLALAALAEAMAGQAEDARAHLAALAARFPRHTRLPGAMVAARLGDRERAVALLREAFDDGDPGLAEVLADPLLAGLADDARVSALRRDAGLPPAPR